MTERSTSVISAWCIWLIKVHLQYRKQYFPLSPLKQCFNPYPARTENNYPFANSIEPGQHAQMCSLTRLYTVGWWSSHLNIKYNDDRQFQKCMVEYRIGSFLTLIQALYCWLTYFNFFHLDIPKNDNGQCQNSWIIPF